MCPPNPKSLGACMSLKTLACLLTCASAAASAQSQLDPAIAFGARPSVEDISLSPDGTKIAYVAPRAGQGGSVFVATLGGGEPHAAASLDGEPERFGGCDWVSNNRLVCRVFAMMQGTELTPVSRMVAFDADGKNVKVLAQQESSLSRYGNTY